MFPFTVTGFLFWNPYMKMFIVTNSLSNMWDSIMLAPNIIRTELQV